MRSRSDQVLTYTITFEGWSPDGTRILVMIHAPGLNGYANDKHELLDPREWEALPRPIA